MKKSYLEHDPKLVGALSDYEIVVSIQWVA